MLALGHGGKQLKVFLHLRRGNNCLFVIRLIFKRFLVIFIRGLTEIKLLFHNILHNIISRRGINKNLLQFINYQRQIELPGL